MPGYYIYLISSLPMLHFGRKPPFSFERFSELCEELIPEEDIEIVKMTSREDPGFHKRIHPTLKKWIEFDTALRNELAKLRAGRKRQDPFKYVRPTEDGEASITYLALNAMRNPSLIEAEKMLDEERWRKLEELVRGHYFDLDFLIIYALKLLILLRWERIRTADKTALLEDALESANSP